MNMKDYDPFGHFHSEDNLTDFLAYLLRSNPVFASCFLAELSQQLKSHMVEKENIHVRTPVVISALGPDGKLQQVKVCPDLTLKATDPTGPPRLVVIENKLMAREGSRCDRQGNKTDQTEQYAHPAVVDSLKTKHEVTTDPLFVFLTLYPYQRPSSKAFSHYTYTELAQVINDMNHSKWASEKQAEHVKHFLEDFDFLLAQSKVRNPEETMASALSRSDRIEFQYYRFSNFVEMLIDSLRQSSTSDVNLLRLGAYTSSDKWRGHPTLLAKLRLNTEWLGERVPLDSENPTIRRWDQFDARTHFDIHLEVQVDTITSELEAAIHYETNPYISDLKKRGLSYDSFKSRRDAFHAKLWKAPLSSMGWHDVRDSAVFKVARAKLDSARPLAVLTEDLTRLIGNAVEPINNALRQI